MNATTFVFLFAAVTLQVNGQEAKPVNTVANGISPTVQLPNGMQMITHVHTQPLVKGATVLYAKSRQEYPPYNSQDIYTSNPNVYQTRRGTDPLIRGGRTSYIIDGMQVMR